MECRISLLIFDIYIKKVPENWYSEWSETGMKINEATLHYWLSADDQILFENNNNIVYMQNKDKKIGDLKISAQKTEPIYS